MSLIPNQKAPSATVEDYLKALYTLEQRNDGKARIKDIAEHLDVSLPSVTTMMKSLADGGFVERAAYRGVELSEQGRKAALKVIRSHRLIELFLVEVLGYTWDEVHSEAERLEHAMSEDLTNRIDAYLGFPTVDPHGDPIPTAEGVIPRHTNTSLLEAAAHSEQPRDVLITRVLDQTPEVLQYLGSLGLTPGASCTLIRLDPFDGPVWLEMAGASVALSRSLATRVLITP